MSDPTVEPTVVVTPVVESTAAPAPAEAQKTLDDILKEAGFKPDQVVAIKEKGGVATVADLMLLSQDQVAAYSGCTPVAAIKALKAAVPTAPVAPASATNASFSAFMDILPPVPDDTSFIEMLKTSGILKVQPIDVIAAIRAAVASQVGLYGLPDVLMAKMNEFAEAQGEPNGESYYALQKLITTHSYGEILSAIGVSGNFVSEKKKNALLEKLNTRLWSAIYGFHQAVAGWYDTYTKSATNPSMMFNAFAMATSGQGALLSGMMQPPDTSGLRDAAEAVITKINSVFAGDGIPVARALGADATRIKGVLEDPTLPAATGSATKEQMLKTLKIEVGADYVRLERNIVKYALAIMELPKVTAGNTEYGYLNAMFQLGNVIPWEKLTGGRPSGADAGFHRS